MSGKITNSHHRTAFRATTTPNSDDRTVALISSNRAAPRRRAAAHLPSYLLQRELGTRNTSFITRNFYPTGAVLTEFDRRQLMNFYYDKTDRLLLMLQQISPQAATLVKSNMEIKVGDCLLYCFKKLVEFVSLDGDFEVFERYFRIRIDNIHWIRAAEATCLSLKHLIENQDHRSTLTLEQLNTIVKDSIVQLNKRMSIQLLRSFWDGKVPDKGDRRAQFAKIFSAALLTLHETRDYEKATSSAMTEVAKYWPEMVSKRTTMKQRNHKIKLLRLSKKIADIIFDTHNIDKSSNGSLYNFLHDIAGAYLHAAQSKVTADSWFEITSENLYRIFQLTINPDENQS